MSRINEEPHDWLGDGLRRMSAEAPDPSLFLSDAELALLRGDDPEDDQIITADDPDMVRLGSMFQQHQDDFATFVDVVGVDKFSNSNGVMRRHFIDADGNGDPEIFIDGEWVPDTEPWPRPTYDRR